MRLRVNGRDVAVWSCTPHALDALAAGRLLTLGFIGSAAEILAVDTRQDTEGILIDVRVPPVRAAAAHEEREHREEHGCGLRYLVACASEQPDRPADAPEAPSLDTFPSLFRELFQQSVTRSTTGGHHTAAVSDGRRLLHVHEEVGRHNAADKAIGSALLADLPLRSLGLVTTARISGEMAEKAARAGLAWVASRSVATTLAVEIAAARGLRLVARAPGPEAMVLGRPGAEAR